VSATEFGKGERTCKLRRDRKAVDDARRFAELAVTTCDAECRQATALVVSEFAENLVKYGASETNTSAGTIGIAVESDTIRVRARNRVVSAEDARKAQETISTIAGSPSVMDLYRKRLRELFENPTLPRAQLGLLRVAFEGGFKLSCTYRGPELEIVAERRCGRGP
jgi:hypothetical protein